MKMKNQTKQTTIEPCANPVQPRWHMAGLPQRAVNSCLLSELESGPLSWELSLGAHNVHGGAVEGYPLEWGGSDRAPGLLQMQMIP